MLVVVFFVFFFSSRRRHTRYIGDWSSDVCSSDLVLIDDREEAVAVLGQLKALGVQIAVDDFGTGYSSLSYLSGLPIDCLKIDRSFVVQTTDGGRGAAIAQAIISLGHSLRLRVLAEGVETPEQRSEERRVGKRG